MREFHPALSATTKDVPLSLSLAMLSAFSKPVECVASQISLEILTGKTTSMIFCGMLPPLLASEGSRHDGLIEKYRELEFSSSFDDLQFLLGSAAGEFGVSACSG